MNKKMQNEPNLRQSQIFITALSTRSYNEKMKLDTWSKQTQTKPISKGITYSKHVRGQAKRKLIDSVEENNKIVKVYYANSFRTI
jgi:hypothetical protein